MRAIVMFGTIGVLAACNTVDGFGRDVQVVGRGVSNAALYMQKTVFTEHEGETPRVSRDAEIIMSDPCDANPDAELAGGLEPCDSEL